MTKENRILDRNGKQHQSVQTCPGCSADYYDTNFENCPACGHGMVYDLGS